ncbi:sigmaK-factor processing regulatory BofA [Methanofollis formosanus]|uniref:SigmaK-factor processing regulatory BofA n=1 Tax=Methanofollis formosanus TaxID=299308 RepID=A0A8G1A2Y9_9EURY|nr:pro-sigmaK processing inhibitor BofA family protein [Methanofollis formosanus]QYZ79600.1 sigmaK-factor processing regulatory BofA [Methanofollis formosanus]
MIESIILIVLMVGVAALLYYLFREGVKLIINAIVGLVVLYLINLFDLMSYIGGGDLPITWASVIICALGGVVGVVLLVVLDLVGLSV